MTNLKNKIVFITGASSGFGKATANAFAKKGAKLILLARRSNKLKETAAEIKKKYHSDILPVTLDIRNKNDVLSLINKFPKKWTNIDILVNNAGLSRGLDKLQDGKMRDWDEMIDTNVKGLIIRFKSIFLL